MGKKLAIKGHATRGNEVIELLVMMGGSDNGSWWGNDIGSAYFINDWTQKIDVCTVETDIVVFTLEEFLEKYPYKVGDKVIDCYGNTVTIKSMSWSEDGETMVYDFEETEDVLCAEDLESYKEDSNMRNKEDKLFDSVIWHLRNSVNNGKQNLSGGECEDYFREVVKKNNENKMKNVLAELLEHIKTTPKEELEREFEEIKGWSNVGPTVEEFRTFCECVNKKPKYPKTYTECCKILNYMVGCTSGYKSSLLASLQSLLICRDAYWKIAGDEMGLGKPWEPKSTEMSHAIVCRDDGDFLLHRRTRAILIFPTIEMRDAFYENFNDLIERCKELL